MVPQAIGNGAMARLLAAGPGALKAQPAIAHAAGNRAVQRLTAPVQRLNEGKDEEAPQPSGGYLQQHVTPGTRTGPLPGVDGGGHPPLMAPEPVRTPMPGAHREVDANTGRGAMPPHLIDNQVFKKATTANDVVSGVTGTGGGADFVGLSDAVLGTRIADWTAAEIGEGFLPGAGLMTNLLSIGEGVGRADGHRERANAMSQSAGQASPRIAEMLQAGARDQTAAADRHTGRTWVGAMQTGLMAGGMMLGAPGLLTGAAVLGGTKAAESVYNKGKQLWEGEGDSKANARELIDAALAGDPGALAALRTLGVDPDTLVADEESEDAEVMQARHMAAWQARRDAEAHLGGMMPKQHFPHPDVDPLEAGLTGGTQQMQPDLGAALLAPAAARDERADDDADEPPPLGMVPNPLAPRRTVTDDSLLLDPGRSSATAMDVPTLDIPTRRRRRRPPQQQQQEQAQEQARSQPASADGDYVIEEDLI